jgi:hypothetical protein
VFTAADGECEIKDSHRKEDSVRTDRKGLTQLKQLATAVFRSALVAADRAPAKERAFLAFVGKWTFGREVYVKVTGIKYSFRGLLNVV